MLLIAPIMRQKPMLRTWAAMFGASIAALYSPSLAGYMVIDGIAAAIIMSRPAGLPQRAIGALFALMMVFDLGFYLSPQQGWDLFVAASTAIGWVQWAILGVWAGHDAWGRYIRWSDPRNGIPPPVQRGAR